MNLARDINIKPSFLRELHALPTHMTNQVWEKINFLAQNPIPDGHLKKKLVKWDDVYRLRIGDYRLFYSFGGNWIRLLSMRTRKNAYQRGISYEEPIELGHDFDADLIEDEEVAAGVEQIWSIEKTIESKNLPMSINSEWLEQLNIPNNYHPKLIACKTEDDLLVSEVPDKFIERVIDNLFPRPVQEILQQPDLIVFDSNDLIRYKEGDLLGFLLRLDSDQERLVDWALEGPALIKGGPGTGKSTIALYRVRSLLDHYKKQGKSNLKILFTTYTDALARFSNQLLEQLLQDRIHHVKIETADELANQIVQMFDPKLPIADRGQLKVILEESLRKVGQETIFEKYRSDYLLDEFEWIIAGRNMKEMNEYLEVTRNGRGIALNGKAREAVWKCYQIFSDALANNKVTTIFHVRSRAYELVRSGLYQEKYSAVIIDEAQDLTPVTLSLLSELAVSNKGIYLTADASQSIYYKGFSWSEIHNRLQFRGRAINLRRNYRTTKEISEAATQFLKQTSSGDPESLMSRSAQSGPQPLLFGYDSKEEQIQYIVKFIRQMSKHLRLKASSAAVLVPSSSIGKEIAEDLTKAGLPSRFMRGAQLDLQSEQIKVLTLASSKGLEFPIVCIAGIEGRAFPKLTVQLEEEDYLEELKNTRRTLYVGITRSMRGLLLLYSKKNPSRLVQELDAEYWHIL
ncbi:superfamily I DNA/RNA helicase/mRNA-degrading endonuclease RelE of RelBE toxin-antitoxin system [Paenibacillus sp. V4I3]|uniref:3'-5' exonuclease n=1 Tax=Paenibacillus sp. V4I3 TaxID=3042305 RepID=UPI00278B7CD9|nr:3'-5' exonuclease [Paenibacillus sp. V4I3]MDQ0878977.1 superfamily I DNA/RNA helicase/mRNA-degrading endonuclease RelE of RelBE toxin-antitoxin system [Paenibacillus sp. V4I3]